MASAAPSDFDGCQSCHANRTSGFAAGHAFGSGDCVSCHRGDPAATTEAEAHAGLIAFPGNLSNAADSCGGCHPERVSEVLNSLMHSGRGMVHKTRRVFGEPAGNDPSIQRLKDSPADSLLGKLCAGCHLGRDKTGHALDAVKDRGGGCLACHINEYPSDAHPQLSAKVRDERCFGCHSRSSRIALNYAGLAEVDAAHPSSDRGRLSDGRLVERRARDVHHRAGMGCIDCHTGMGVMGGIHGAAIQRDAVDIACQDCHANRHPRLSLEDWPARQRGQLQRIPFPVVPGQEFLTTAHGTPLWHIEVRPEGNRLHRKLSTAVLEIPPLSEQSHPPGGQHARLTCNACHSQWAPQCHGCHTAYKPDERQWDHRVGEITPGRWVERRWNIRNDLPALGVTAADRIGPFIPGMILTIEHPAWQRPRFQRLFAASAPHTSGPSRSCASCHNQADALGLGRGRLSGETDGWRFEPEQEVLADGLAADAWTGLDRTAPGASTVTGDRSFTHKEMMRILDAETQPAPKGGP